MMTTLLAAVCLANQAQAVPGSDQLVSISSPVQRVERLLPALSKATGLQLAASTNTRDDLVCVIAEKVKSKDLLSKVAEAVNAEWQRTETGWRLARTITQSQRSERLWREELASRIAVAIQSRKISLSKMEPFEEAQARALAKVPNSGNIRGGPKDENAFGEPLGRALTKLQTSLEAKTLVDLPTGVFTAFATSPNASQRSLGAAGEAVLRSLRRDLELFNQAKESVAKTKTTEEEIPPWDPNPGVLPQKLVLSIMPFGNGQLFVTRLISIARDGQELGTFEDALTLEDRDGKRMVNDEAFNGSGPKEADLPAWTAETQLINKDEKTEEEKLRIQALLRDPLERDPCSFGNSELLSHLSKATGRPVVAHLSDISAVAATLMPRDFSMKSWSMLYRMFGGRRETKDGWEVLWPADAERARRSRADRRALKTYASAILSADRLGLEQICEVQVPLPPEFANPIPEMLHNRLGRKEGLQVSAPTQLFGALTPDERREAMRAGIPVGKLTPAVRQLAAQWIFGQSVTVNVSEDVFPQGLARNALNEVTEHIPRGLAATAILRLTPGSTRMVALSSPGKRAFQISPLDSLAFTMTMDDSPELRWPPKATWLYAFSDQQQMTLTLHLNPKANISSTIQHSPGGFSKPVPYESIPPAIRQPLEQKIAEEKTNRTKRGNGGG